MMCGAILEPGHLGKETMKRSPVRLLKSNSLGAVLTEYAILLFCLAIIAMASVTGLGIKVRDIFNGAAVAVRQDEATSPDTVGSEDLGYPPGGMIMSFEGDDASITMTPGPEGATIFWSESDKQQVSGPGTYSKTYSETAPQSVSSGGQESGVGLQSLEFNMRSVAVRPQQATSGLRTVVVVGQVDALNGVDPDLVEVVSFGDVGLKSIERAFAGAKELTRVAVLPTTVTKADYAFEDGGNPEGLDQWDTSKLETLKGMFNRNARYDRDDLNAWDVSSATNFESMFNLATAYSGDLSNWCVRHHASEPSKFNESAPNMLPPIWGACGRPKLDPNAKPIVLSFMDRATVFLATSQPGGLIHWGDGTVQRVKASQTYTRNYKTPGTYDVHIEGAYTGFRADNLHLVEVKSFGEVGLTSLDQAFKGAANLVRVAALPPTVKTLRNTFQGVGVVGANPEGLASWDTSNVTNINQAFLNNQSFNKGGLALWNVRNITDMTEAFLSAKNFAEDISEWCVPHIAVRPSRFMDGAGALKEPVWGYCGASAAKAEADAKQIALMFKDQASVLLTSTATGGLIHWGDGEITSVPSGTGTYAHVYQTPGTYEVRIDGRYSLFKANNAHLVEVKSFGDVGLTSLAYAFENAGNLARVAPLPATVTDLTYTFSGAGATPNGANPDGLEAWDTKNVTKMTGTFYINRNYDKQGPVGWNVANVTALNQTFLGATKFSGDLSSWCVPQFAAMPSEFSTSSLIVQPIWGSCGKPQPDPNTPAMILTFKDQAEFRLTATAPGRIFWGDGTVTSVPSTASSSAFTRVFSTPGSYDVRIEGRFSYMKADNLYITEVKSFGDVGLTSLTSSFTNAGNLAKVAPLPNTVVSLNSTFSGSGGTLTGANPDGLEAWDTSRVTNMTSMFFNNRNYDKAGPVNWNVANVTSMTQAFWGASKFSADLSNWCVPQFVTMPAEFNVSSPLIQPIWGYCGKPKEDPNATAMIISFVDRAEVKLVATKPSKIFWGDGSVTPVPQSGTLATFSKTYSTPGEYEARMEGTFSSMRVDNLYVKEVKAFDNVGLTSLANAFQNAKNLTHVPALPSTVTNLTFAFAATSGSGNGPNPQGLENWNTDNVTNMRSMFQYNSNFNNPAVANWNVAKVTDMVQTFFLASSFRQDLSGWCVPQFTTMPTQFTTTPQDFAQPVWGHCGQPQPNPDANPIIMSFKNTAQFVISPTQPGLIFWGDGSVQSIASGASQTFTKTYASAGDYDVRIEGRMTSLRADNLGLLEVKSFGDVGLTSLANAFQNASNLTRVARLPSTVTNLSSTFAAGSTASAWPNPAGLDAWDISNVTSLSNTFAYNKAITGENIAGWKVDKVTSMTQMLFQATNFRQDLSGWCVSNIPSMPTQFTTTPQNFEQPVWGHCGKPQPNPDADPIIMTFRNTAQVVVSAAQPGLIFWGDGSVQSFPAGASQTISKTYAAPGDYDVRLEGRMTTMRANNLGLIEVKSFGDVGLTSLANAFDKANNLIRVAALPSSVTNLSYTFAGSTSDGKGPNPDGLSSWNTENVTTMVNMFYYNQLFDKVEIADWNVSNVSNMTGMFLSSKIFKGDLSKWCVSKIATAPSQFSSGASFPNPVWGTCPAR